MNNTGIIILAAGSATRFGNIKQLLFFKNKTLLQHVIDEATITGALPVIVVTGANAKEVASSINTNSVDVIFNKNWKQGMASGIVTGLQRALLLHKNLEQIIITVCDQPFVSASLFNQLYQAQSKKAKAIVASSYAGTTGTPALFTKQHFPALLLLKGEEGAKKILKAHAEDIIAVDFPQGSIDIDTQKNYEDLLNT